MRQVGTQWVQCSTDGRAWEESVGELPEEDAWGNEMRFVETDGGSSFAIRSAGLDGRFENVD